MGTLWAFLEGGKQRKLRIKAREEKKREEKKTGLCFGGGKELINPSRFETLKNREKRVASCKEKDLTRGTLK